MKVFVLLVLLVAAAQADVYLHSPRGSNNRLDEANRDRNNANRLFDSQNNNRGGYNVGGIYYYEGSTVHFEWTNQHSCNDENNHCELILQYTCDSAMRDGSTTSTIPENPSQCRDFNCQTDLKYGMHENFDYYQNCKYRSRNKGLFIADRNLNGRSARFTRQNNAGTRRGYECPEERDYYPYWGPTQWRDAVILTSNVSRCPFYQETSQNVQSRFACQVPDPYFQYYKRCGTRNGYIIPITQEECEAVSWNYERDARNTRCAQSITAYDPTHPTSGENSSLILWGKWQEYPSFGIAAPDCQEAPWSRDNHLGNGIGGFPNTYNLTIPDLNHEFCVFRMRYNISTSEFDAWADKNWTDYNAAKPRPGNPTNIPIWDNVRINETEARSRGYVFRQNPVVHMFGDANNNLPLRLAINTNQFSRTFQDRTHTFAVRRRPTELRDAVIHNVQVRGKRGNIVQTYPGVEYDYVPNRLQVAQSEYLHFQWTGSNTNPNNNAGQGKQGTDRHNIVMLEEPRYAEGMTRSASDFGQWGLNYPQHLDNTSFLGLNRSDLDTLALLDTHQFRGEMSELDDAGTYFDMKPRKVTLLGTYHYMCTRNNNFSNRSQKGKLVCSVQATKYKSIGWNGGEIALTGGANRLQVPRGTFTQPQAMRMEHWKTTDCQALLENLGSSIYGKGETASDCVALFPEERIVYGKDTMWMTMKLTDSANANGKLRVYQTTTGAASSWTEVTVNSSDASSVTFQAVHGGIFVVKKEPNVVLIASITAACVLVGFILLGTIVYFKRYPGKWTKIRTNTAQSLQYTVRSFQSKV